MTERVITFISCNPFSDARTSLLCFQVIPYKKKSLTFCHLMSFYAFQVSFEKMYYTFAEEPDKLFRRMLKEKTFASVGKCCEHLERRESLCLHCPRVLIIPDVSGLKNLRELIRCLYSNVINRLFVAISQIKNNSREQILRLGTSQVALIRAPVVH